MPEVLSPNPTTPAKTAKTADDINDLFKELDNEPEPKPKVEKPAKQVDEPSDKDLDDIDDEDTDIEFKEPEEDEDVEKLDLKKEDEEVDITAPPRKREILKEYPELFKKFLFLEKMMYRDKEYNELFGSFDDAKEVAGRAEVFNEFETQLLSGDTVEVLKSVKDTDETAFNKIVDNYLVNLHKVDKDAYSHVVGNLNKRLIIEMMQEGNDTNNEDLKQAALLVNQFVFGTSKFTAPTNRVAEVKPDEAKNEVEAERLALVQERFESVRDELQTRVDNTLRATISEYIDPKGVMSAYVKKNAVTDAMNNLTSAIAADPTVAVNLNKLWKAAFDGKFSKDTQGKIQSYYLSKAKVNLKKAIISARAEALKDLAPKREMIEEEVEEEKPQSRRIVTGRPSQPKSSKNEMRKGESVNEFFARD